MVADELRVLEVDGIDHETHKVGESEAESAVAAAAATVVADMIVESTFVASGADMEFAVEAARKLPAGAENQMTVENVVGHDEYYTRREIDMKLVA
jgi:hypothetical protein